MPMSSPSATPAAVTGEALLAAPPPATIDDENDVKTTAATSSDTTAPAAPPAQPDAAAFPSHYATQFAAIGTLLAGSLQRAAKSGGSYAHVDMQIQQQQPMLVLEDDAAGPSPQTLRRCCGIPLLANSCTTTLPPASSSGEPSATRWSDFVHAVTRLGSLALLLSRRNGAGASVAMLSCSCSESGEAQVEAAVVDFAADGSRQLALSSKLGAPATDADAALADASARWQGAIDAIGRNWPDRGSEQGLKQQLQEMPEQGMRLLIARLHKAGAGSSAANSTGAARAATTAAGVACTDAGFELDWASDPTDLKAQAAAGKTGLASRASMAGLFAFAGSEAQKQQASSLSGKQRRQQRQDAAMERCMEHQRSLRAFMALLFLRLPIGFQLRLRGSAVKQQLVRDWMQWPAMEEYRPRGIRDEVDEHGFQMQHVVGVHLGLLQEAPNTSLQGICIYHENRLVKPFWRVYTSTTAGSGVVGYLEADFLEPAPGWQDFKKTHVLSKLEAFLKRAVPAYWKRHVHLLASGSGTAKAPATGHEAQRAAAATPPPAQVSWPVPLRLPGAGLAPPQLQAAASLSALQQQQQQLLAATASLQAAQAHLLAQAQAHTLQPQLAALLAGNRAPLPAPQQQDSNPAAQLLSLLARSSPTLQQQLTQQVQQQRAGSVAALAAALQGAQLIPPAQPQVSAPQPQPFSQVPPVQEVLARLNQLLSPPLADTLSQNVPSAFGRVHAAPAGLAAGGLADSEAALSQLLLQLLSRMDVPRQGRDTESAAGQAPDGTAGKGEAGQQRDGSAAKRARLT